MKRQYVTGFMLGALSVLSLSLFAQRTAPVQEKAAYEVTMYPNYGVAITPHDTNLLTEVAAIRADSAGAVTARCVGSASTIVLNLAAGEFFPCVVNLVPDTGTDAITIHGFY